MSLRTKLLVLALLVEGGVFIVALVLARIWSIPLFPLSEHILRDILIGTAAAVIPFALFCFSLSERAKTIPIINSVRKTITVDIRTLFASSTVVDIFLISLLAGLAQEMLFRGVIQAKCGIIAASILFGLLHSVTPAYIFLATLIGLYIGLLYNWESLL